MTSSSKVIVVLGAGPGLGMSMARRFGREGFLVALVSRTGARHAAYRAQLAADGIESRSYAADVTDPAQVRDVLSRIAADLGDIDTVYYGPAAVDIGSGIVPLPDAGAAQVRASFEPVVLPAVDVVAAVFTDRADTVVGICEHALAMDDPWDGFVHFVEQTCRMQAADRGYNDLSARSIPQAAPTSDLERGYALMTEVVERAKRAGALRGDFVLADMAFVIWAISRTIEATGDVEPQAWRRHLGFVLDGLRAPAAHPLPVPALTDEQVRRIMRDC